MKIEIVEFYLMGRNDEKQQLKGTLHIYLCDHDIDLRGISVTKRKDIWFFGMPSRNGIDPDTEKNVQYPIFSFTNREKSKQLLDEIIQKGKEYILRNVLETKDLETLK